MAPQRALIAIDPHAISLCILQRSRGYIDQIVGGAMNLIHIAIFLAGVTGQASSVPTRPDAAPQDPIDQALHQMYNADFAGAQTVITEEISRHPKNPFLYALRAGALLFSEFSRMKVLELEFFADDESVTGRNRLKPDPTVRADFFRAIGEARKLAEARLAADPNDTDAIFALYVAVGIETDYVLLVEKRYFRGYSLSKEGQKYTTRLLAMNPPVYDAYLSLGMLEYGVGNLNFFFRLFVRFNQVKGDRKKAIEYLQLVVDHGRYYAPFAKILLSAIYVREKKPAQALVLLKELEQDFPENPLIRQQILRLSTKIGQQQPGKSSR